MSDPDTASFKPETITIEPSSIKRFVQIASHGGKGASHGEQVARKIARTLHAIGDDFAIIDREALEGLCLLILLAGGPYPTDAHKERVFSNIKRAAGYQ